MVIQFIVETTKIKQVHANSEQKLQFFNATEHTTIRNQKPSLFYKPNHNQTKLYKTIPHAPSTDCNMQFYTVF